MSAVILKDLREHAKYRKWKQQHIDPRNASRTPSASKEPMYRLRYESPIGASPSRQTDHQKPFYDDDPTFDRSTSYRGSVGRSLGTAPSYNGNIIFYSNRTLFAGDTMSNNKLYYGDANNESITRTQPIASNCSIRIRSVAIHTIVSYLLTFIFSLPQDVQTNFNLIIILLILT